MAVQDFTGYIVGTPLTWQSSGGTYVITCTSLAAGSSRQGAKSNSIAIAPPNGTTSLLPDYLIFSLLLQFTAAPAAGGEVSLFLGFSSSATAGTSNPGGLTGTDAAGPNIDVFPQLVFAGSLIASNNLSTGAQFQYFQVVPLDQYICPVIYNNASQNFDATALHTVLTMTPYWRERAT